MQENDAPCISPQQLNYIMNNCENGSRVWVKVNFHFFLPPDCEGSIDPNHISNGFNNWGTDIPADSTYAWAEFLINQYNSVLENNQPQRNLEHWTNLPPANEAPCNPIRYLLNGVYIHCDPIQTTGVSSVNNLNNTFGVNTNSEFNVYLIHHTWASGQANSIPGNSMVIGQWGDWGLFNHEMGHLFGLSHSEVFDDLDDTPEIKFQYDFNCDGDLADSWPSSVGGVGSESEIRQCWAIQDNHPPIDYDGTQSNAVLLDPCNPDPSCEVYPCCQDIYFNNNVMAYGQFKTAWSAGQITTTLNWFNESYVIDSTIVNRCNFIEYIGDECPPPAANIGILPKINFTDCSYCLFLEASVNDESYSLEFFDSNGNSILNTGLINGAAQQYCISIDPRTQNFQKPFNAGQTYTASLKVLGVCGNSDTEEIEFTLPYLNCNNIEREDIVFENPSPNPHTNNFTIDYTLLSPGSLQIMLVNVINPANSMMILPSQEVETGNYQYDVSTSSLPNGIYSLLYLLENQVYSSIIIKE